MDSYVPLNQAFFQSNSIAAVQAILFSLSQIFDSLEMGTADNKIKTSDSFEFAKVIEPKIWNFEELVDVSFSSTTSQSEKCVSVVEYAPLVFKEIRKLN